MEFKNQCLWSLTVSFNDRTKTVEYPLTCEFNIERNVFSQAKHCTLNIYNLSPSTRQDELFRHDRILDHGNIKAIEFSAGYKNNMVTCFRGIIQEAYSARRGTDVITTIQACDEGFSSDNKKPLNITFKAGTKFVEAFNTVANELKHLKPTTRGILEGEFKTDTTLYGTPLQILNQITNNHTFVDNSEVKTLNNNECVESQLLDLSAQGSLLETPQARSNFIVAKTLFNPSVIAGQRALLKTTSLNYYNGIYKVYGINHQGIISAAVNGQRTTTLTLMIKDALPNSNVNITAQTERQGEKLVNGTDVYTPGQQSVENAYRYIRANNGKIPNWKINQLISWADMIGHDNKDEERFAQLTPSILANCVTIANKLHMFLSTSSLKGKKIQIQSGWRSKENNARCKGSAKESAHLRGAAIDLNFVTINTKTAYDTVFNPNWSGFTYPYRFGATGSYFIHVQTSLGKGGAPRDGLKTK